MSAGADVALRKGFHKLTAYDMARKCRAMLDARPTCEFAALEPGKTYCYKPPYGNRFELLTIGEVTPKRTQAVASIDGREPRRIYKGSYTGTFAELDADLVALAGIRHSESGNTGASNHDYTIYRNPSGRAVGRPAARRGL
jgi:hypothetical protein